MRKAQIENGLVINVIEVDPDHVPDWCRDWPTCEGAGPGWAYAEGEFHPPRTDITPIEAMAAVMSAITAVEDALTAGVPLAEKLSWSAKEAAARAIVAGVGLAADQSLLAGEAALTGETVEDLAARVIARADLYRFAVSRLAGIRRAAGTAIAAAQRPDDLEQAVALAQAQCAAIIEGASE